MKVLLNLTGFSSAFMQNLFRIKNIVHCRFALEVSRNQAPIPLPHSSFPRPPSSSLFSIKTQSLVVMRHSIISKNGHRYPSFVFVNAPKHFRFSCESLLKKTGGRVGRGRRDSEKEDSLTFKRSAVH